MSQLLYLSGAPRVSSLPSSPEPGARNHILGITTAFTRLGWDVRRVIAGDYIPRRLPSRGQAGAPPTGSFVSRCAADAARLSSHAILSRLARIRSRTASLIYERIGLLQCLGARSAESRAPWIVETQGLMWRDAIASRCSTNLRQLAMERERMAYRMATGVVAVSSAVRDDVIAFAGIPADRVLVLPNGVNTSSFQPPATQRAVPQSTLHVGFIGALVGWQGIDLLLEAIAKCRTAGIPVRATVAGDGPFLAPWQGLATSLGVNEQVRFVGRVSPELSPEFLGSVDLGYCGHGPSCGRTMYHSPLKLYEYMACGLPIIATDYPDARSVCPIGQTSLLFTAGNVSALTGSLTYAWLNREALPAIGAQMRSVAVNQHDWIARVQTLLDWAKHLLGANRRGA
jgi:glycosyltransferase involved in cell wall biosynthesis